VSAVIPVVVAAYLLLAQLAPPERSAIEDYRAALRDAEARRPPASLEPVFARALRVGEALLHVRGDGRAAIESLPAADFARLVGELPGLIVNRDETVYVKPDPAYFLRLAQRHGTPADRAFFEAYHRTLPDGVWPAYVKPQTDYSGCTAFGQGELVATYRVWREFARAFPGSYGVTVARLVRDVEVSVAQSTCACGDAASVERELHEFLTTFPGSPVSTAIAQRLRELRARRSAIRFVCLSG